MTDPRHDEPELGLPDAEEPKAPALETDGWNELLAVLDRVPFVGVLKRDMQSLSRLVYERRVARLAFIASPDANVAGLLAALMGATPQPAPRTSSEQTDANDAGWLELEADDRHLDVLATPPDTAQAALEGTLPDVLLVVATPAEVDAGLGHHLDAAVRFLAGTEARDERAPAFVPVLVQRPPIAVAPARASFARQLADAGLVGVDVATVGLADGLAPVGADELAERVAETLPDTARVEGGRAFPGARRMRRRVAAAITRTSSTLAVTVAVAPIPLSDLALLAPLQAVLVTSIAYLSGRPWDRKTAVEWIGGVGVVGAAGFGLRWGAQQAVKVLPGLGSVVSASIAGAGTLAVGRSAATYFFRD